jgi:hypothetical protein
MPIMVGVARVHKPVELVVNVQSSEGGFNVVSNSAHAGATGSLHRAWTMRLNQLERAARSDEYFALRTSGTLQH